MNKSKRLRLERQACLSRRRECEMLLEAKKQQLYQQMIDINHEIEREKINKEVVA